MGFFTFEFMTMEEVFLVTYGGVFAACLLIVVPIAWAIEKRRDKDGDA